MSKLEVFVRLRSNDEVEVRNFVQHVVFIQKTTELRRRASNLNNLQRAISNMHSANTCIRRICLVLKPTAFEENLKGFESQDNEFNINNVSCS